MSIFKKVKNYITSVCVRTYVDKYVRTFTFIENKKEKHRISETRREIR